MIRAQEELIPLRTFHKGIPQANTGKKLLLEINFAYVIEDDKKSKDYDYLYTVKINVVDFPKLSGEKV